MMVIHPVGLGEKSLHLNVSILISCYPESIHQCQQWIFYMLVKDFNLDLMK